MELLYDEPLFPAPKGLADLGWQNRSVTTSEAGRWLRSLLSKRLGDIEYTTVHTLKSTPLSWCAKAGLDQNTRLLLGHHSTGKQSAEVYVRDSLAAPLRDFDNILQQIRTGTFRPDSTRSGMVGEKIRDDPKVDFCLETDVVAEPESSSSSSSEEESSSDESHAQLALPNDPVAEQKQWDPDFTMFQHTKSQIVHLKAVGSQRNSFSCGVKQTPEYKIVEKVDFLVFRKCKRCAITKPVKDVGALAAALKKRRLEFEASAK